MKYLLTLLWVSLLTGLTLTLQNCKKTEPDPVKPGGTTNPGSSTSTPGATSTAPTVGTASAPTASGITSTSATISAVIEGNGGAAISQHGFVYSKTVQTPTVADSKTELGATTGPFPLMISSSLTGLDANTTYYVRAYATNDKGTGYGAVGQVKTSAAETSTNGLANWKTARSLGEGFDYTRTNDLIADANGNYYLSGTYSRAGKIGKFSVNPTGSASQDGFIVKMDPTGEPLWIVELKSTSSDEVLSLNQDAAGNIYAALSAGTATGTFGAVQLPAGGGHLAKITAQGAVEWVRSTVTGTNAAGAWVTDVDAQGNYYVRGRIIGNNKVTIGSTTLTGSDPAWTLNNGTEGWDHFLARFDPSGKMLWVRQFSGAGNQDIKFDVDPNGSIYMDLQSEKGPPSVGNTALSSAGEFLLKLSATGTVEWTKTIHTTGGTSHINGIICKNTGEFLAVTHSQTGIALGGATTTASNPVAMALYREDGNVKWAITTPGLFTDASTLDKSGNLYVVSYGNQNQPFRIGDVTLPAQSGEKTYYMVVAKYSPTQSKWLWAIRNRVVSGTSGTSDPYLGISPTGGVLLNSSAQMGDVQFGAVTATMPSRFGVIIATIEQK